MGISKIAAPTEKRGVPEGAHLAATEQEPQSRSPRGVSQPDCRLRSLSPEPSAGSDRARKARPPYAATKSAHPAWW